MTIFTIDVARAEYITWCAAVTTAHHYGQIGNHSFTCVSSNKKTLCIQVRTEKNEDAVLIKLLLEEA